VHELQPLALAHGSDVPPQLLGYHVQLAQLPLDGPVDEPVMHVLVLEQNPHADIDVQPLHVVADAHGSVVEPLHSLGYQRHIEHEPDVGPAELPDMHVLVPAQ